MTDTTTALPTLTMATNDLANIVSAGYTPTPGYDTISDPAARAYRLAVQQAHYMIGAVLAPPADIATADPTAQTVILFPDYYLHGPGQTFARATLCDHGYRLTDTCPGCDHDQDTRQGVFSTPAR